MPITVGVIAMFFIFTPDYQNKLKPCGAILQLVDYTCSQCFSISNRDNFVRPIAKIP